MFHALLLFLHLSNPYFKVGDVVCVDTIFAPNFSDNEFLLPIKKADDILTVKIEKVGKRHYLYKSWGSYSKHWIENDNSESPIKYLDNDRHICTNEELMIVGFE